MPENNDEYRNVQREELTTCLTDDLNELRQHDVNIRDFFPDALVGDLDLRTVAVVEGYGPLEIADCLREL